MTPFRPPVRPVRLAVVCAALLPALTAPAAAQGWNAQEILKTEAYVRPPANV